MLTCIQDGTVTFNEFLIFQSITAPTLQPLRPEELIDLAFDMYDKNGDGLVTPEEMTESLFDMFKAKGMDCTLPEVQASIHQRVENLLRLADSNNDGALTREEIMRACQKDPSLLVIF